MTDFIEKVCEREGYRLAKKIDDNLAIIIKKKPFWCPNWLYKKIINTSVLLIRKNKY